MKVTLPLVVGGAAAEEIACAHGGFERRRGPQIQRLGGLHVVVSVKKNGGLAGRFERFRVNQRMHTGRNDFDFFESGGAQFFGDPARRAFDVRLVFAFRADAGNTQEFAKLGEVLLAVVFDEFSEFHCWMPSDSACMRSEIIINTVTTTPTLRI